MADSKETKLSIILRAVDKATAPIRALNARIAKLSAPLRAVGARFASIARTGVSALIDAFKAVGSVIGDVLSKIPLIGTAIAATAGAAFLGLKSLVDHFDDLGDTAQRVGVSVDFLAQMRYAAKKTGTEVTVLDQGLKSFSENLGRAKAGTGRMAAFLEKVYPPLLKQLKAAKSNEEAFRLLADAMSKLKDPAKRSALAMATVGDSALAPMLAQGAKGVQALGDRYTELAGSQQEAAQVGGEVQDSFKDLSAATDGAKAALLTGLGPALKIIIDKMRDWLTGHKAEIAEWAKNFGEKLPAAIQSTIDAVSSAVDKVKEFFGFLADIYDKIKSLYELRDPTAQAKKIAAEVPEAQRPEVERAMRAQGAAVAGGRSTGLSILGGAFGLNALADTEVGRAGVAQRLNALGVNPAIIDDPTITGELHKAIADQLDGQPDVTAQVRSAIAGRPDVTDQASSTVAGSRPASLDDIVTAMGQAQSTAKITVDFSNAPRGTRVKADPQSTADVDFSVGYNLLPGTP